MRHLLHVLASIAMWCLFGYYWYVVLEREVSAATVQAVVILAVVVLAGLTVTVIWIAHNQRLARRFAGRRRQRPDVPQTGLERDTLGRPIEAPDLADLRRAPVIEIAADAERKTYRAVARELAR